LKQLRAQLGNDIAIEDLSGRVAPVSGRHHHWRCIGALHWNEAASDENDKVLASGFPGAGLPSSVARSAVNVQFVVKDSKKYPATGGWGFADFTNGKAGDEPLHKRCFPCHQPAKDRDLSSPITRLPPELKHALMLVLGGINFLNAAGRQKRCPAAPVDE